MTDWRAFIARTAVRRVVYVVVALVLAWAGIGRAEAATVTYPDRQAAYAGCMAEASTGEFGGFCSPSTTRYQCRLYTASSHVHCGNKPGLNEFHAWTIECPAGATWDEATKVCHSPSACQARPNLGAMTISGSGTTACSDGCAFEPAGTSLTLSGDAASGPMTYGSTWAPTGAACSVGESTPAPNTDPQQCKQAANGQTYCLKSNGDHCYSASTGRQICWRPGETGEKTDGDKKQRRDPGETPQTPNPLDNGDTLVQEGDPITTTTTTSDGRTITTTTTNYGTGSGADAGSGDQGQPGDGTGTGDGEGEDDEGDGTPAGDGTYDRMDGADGRTLAGVIAAHRARMQNAPIVSAGSGFFDIGGASGSCPVWTLPATDFTPSVAMDFWCVSELTSTWQWFGMVMLIVFGWAAFRVAML